MAVTKKRVFISFDYDHDIDLKNFLVGQSKNEGCLAGRDSYASGGFTYPLHL
jgi:hypothetical protein